MFLILALFTCVAMPLYAVYLAWSSRKGGRLNWVFRTLAAAGVMAFLGLVARWDWLSVHLVRFWWALLVAAVIASFLTVRNRGWTEGAGRGAIATAALEMVIGLGLWAYAATGFLYRGPAVDLAWPLGDGRYFVGQGGNVAMLNYHNSTPAQRYALDILALDAFGRRADRFQPTALDDYRIFNTDIRSPCAGRIVALRDGIADNRIGATNTAAPAGNHVKIACNATVVELAHFRPGSIAVAVGDTVTTGQRLGAVGNSGNSTEPHLHIHATRGGRAVPLTFGGVFPVRNTVVTR